LQYYGIDGQIISWITSFLTHRKQKVVCDWFTSDAADITSGAPQGSVLGPLLFLIFINDLPSCVSSTCRLFADDCLLYRQIKSSQDSEVLQHDLLCLVRWANKWLMQFNPAKCVILKVIHKANPIYTQYTLYGQILSYPRGRSKISWPYLG